MRAHLRTVLASGAAWLLGGAASVTVALVALSLIGGGLGARGANPPTTERTPATGAGSPAAGSPRAPATQAAVSAPGQVLRSDGGFVVASCPDGQAYLASWTPEPGYEARGVHRGPASSASVDFEGARSHLRLIVTCAGGVPQAQVVHETDDGHVDE